MRCWRRAPAIRSSTCSPTSQDVKLASYDIFYDHGWHLDVHSLERAITERTRAVMVVSPNNPTGSLLRGGEAAALEEICARRGLAIVADEVFLDYALEAAAGGSWAARDTVLNFTLSGLSKIAALPQIKLAWCVVGGPADAKREALSRLEMIADTFLSVNAPVQHALPELLATAPAMQQQIAARCRENLKALDAALGAYPACSRLRADAGWNAILRIPRQGSDEAFAVRLLEAEGVLVHPGHFYNFMQEGYVVVSLLVKAQAFAAGIKKLLAMAEGRNEMKLWIAYRGALLHDAGHRRDLARGLAEEPRAHGFFPCGRTEYISISVVRCRGGARWLYIACLSDCDGTGQNRRPSAHCGL